MNPRFHPCLVNGPRGDPVVYIEFKFERRAILFDLGELRPLTPRKLLKVSHVFVSHAHMDHFMGFDTLLRVSLGREKTLFFYGPPGFIGQVEAKLLGYSWNLVENYPHGLEIRAVEVHPDHLREACFPVREAFRRRLREETRRPFNGPLLEEESFAVKAAFLDHKIPCLAFSLEEVRHLNIRRTGLEELQLPKGLWLKSLKEAVWRGEGDDFPIRVWARDQAGFRERTFSLGFLREHLVKVTPGQKITFAVDTILNEDTEKTLRDLACEADLFYVEAAFLDADRERAREKNHLTAGQAGRLARLAGVKRLVPVHFSPKYAGDPSVLEREALEAFAGPS
jgi:ribonuclease Z